MEFRRNILELDCERETERIVAHLREARRRFRRNGAVVGISGGIDSTVVAALCVRAFGAERVLGIAMPERESSPLSAQYAENLARTLGISFRTEDITPILEGAGTYLKRDEAIRELVPRYGEGWKCKIVLPNDLLERGGLNIFSLVAESPEGEKVTCRIPVKSYLQIVAASNYKQRTRMMTLYFHAERINSLVAGTGNKNEHDQGFFVKYGDGGADVKPIVHLYKSQVFQLGRYLEVPEEILKRTPTTDTYSSEVTQEEFFFRVDFETMDLLWYAMEHRVPTTEAAEVMGLTVEQVKRVQQDILQKYRSTEYLRAQPLACAPASEPVAVW